MTVCMSLELELAPVRSHRELRAAHEGKKRLAVRVGRRTATHLRHHINGSQELKNRAVQKLVGDGAAVMYK